MVPKYRLYDDQNYYPELRLKIISKYDPFCRILVLISQNLQHIQIVFDMFHLLF